MLPTTDKALLRTRNAIHIRRVTDLCSLLLHFFTRWATCSARQRSFLATSKLSIVQLSLRVYTLAMAIRIASAKLGRLILLDLEVCNGKAKDQPVSGNP